MAHAGLMRAQASAVASTSRAFSTTSITLAGGKTKIKAKKGRGATKEHRLGGPSFEEAFDINTDLQTYLGNDVPSVVHARWSEARQRLKGLRLIHYQMPGLQRFRQDFVPPRENAVVRVRTQEPIFGVLGQHHSQSPIRHVSAHLRLGSVPSLASNPKAMHKAKVLAGPRWVPDRSGRDLATKEVLGDEGASGGEPDGHGELVISCDQYASRSQNEKWVSDTIDRLIAEACDLSFETLEDLPLPGPRSKSGKVGRDGYNALKLPVHQFPTQWLSPEAQERWKLDARKQEAVSENRQKRLKGARTATAGSGLPWYGVGGGLPSPSAATNAAK